MKPLSEFRFGQSMPESFVFSKDGRYLYGSSYYTGVSNIFRYEVATGDDRGGVQRRDRPLPPDPLADGRLLVLSLHRRRLRAGDHRAPAARGRERDHVPRRRGRGEVPGGHDVAGAAREQGRRGEARSPAGAPTTRCAQLTLKNAYPVLQGYKNSAGIGYHVNIEDPIPFASIGITAAYTPDHGLPSERARPRRSRVPYLGWRADLSWNRSDFYDLFGPTQRSRKGYAVKGGYDDLLIYDEPRKLELKYDLAYYDKIDTLPGYQNVSSNVDRLVTGEVGLHYTDVQRSLGAVDDEQGIAGEAVLTVNRTEGETIPQLRGGIRPGIRASPAAFLAVAAQRGRRRGRRSQQPPRELLLRRLRQQLRRQRHGQALPRVLLAAGLRDQRGERAQLRAPDGGAEPAAGRLRVASARRPSTSPGCARPSSPRASGPTRATTGCAGATRARARRST